MKNWVAFLLIAIGTGCGNSQRDQIVKIAEFDREYRMTAQDAMELCVSLSKGNRLTETDKATCEDVFRHQRKIVEMSGAQ